MRYPKFLEKDGTIGFVAPSFGCNIEPYRTAFGHALDTFHAKGYQTEHPSMHCHYVLNLMIHDVNFPVTQRKKQTNM